MILAFPYRCTVTLALPRQVNTALRDRIIDMSSLIKKGYTRYTPAQVPRSGISAIDSLGFVPFATYGSRAVGALVGSAQPHPGAPIGDSGQVSREVSKWEGEGGSIVGYVGVLRPFVFGGAGSQVLWPVLAWHREES